MLLASYCRSNFVAGAYQIYGPFLPQPAVPRQPPNTNKQKNSGRIDELRRGLSESLQLHLRKQSFSVRGSKYPILEVSGSKTHIPFIDSGSRNLQYWVLGPSGKAMSQRAAGPDPFRLVPGKPRN